MKKRVVITGLGVVSPNGIGTQDFWQSITQGASGIRPYSWGKALGFESSCSGQVTNFTPKPEDEGHSRYVQFALAAADMAMRDAGLSLTRDELSRTGVVISSAIADAETMETNLLTLTNGGTADVDKSRVDDTYYDTFDFGMAASVVAKRHGAEGVVCNLSTGCTAGLDALGYALDQIRSGEADIMLAGASEAPLCPLSIGSFEALGALSHRTVKAEEASCPFTTERDGFIIAEGCGMFLLESYESAVKRGAYIYAELAGYSSVNNAWHMTDLAADGADLARCMEQALNDADCPFEEVNHVSAHGSSTAQNDINETNAIKSVFGPCAKEIPVNSLKSMTGHSLSAANAVESVALCLEMKHGYLHPTINYRHPDPECDLDYVPNTGRDSQINVALKLSSGFSGIHSVIVLKMV